MNSCNKQPISLSLTDSKLLLVPGNVPCDSLETGSEPFTGLSISQEVKGRYLVVCWRRALRARLYSLQIPLGAVDKPKAALLRARPSLLLVLRILQLLRG